MPAHRPTVILQYRAAAEDHVDLKNEFWGSVADVLVPVAYWTVVTGVVAVFLGAVVLWGVLIAQAT
jgi:hypothetical protein